MKALYAILVLTLVGCSALPTLSYPPSTTPVAPAPTVVIPPQVAAIISLICSSPAASSDPKVAAGCMVLPLLNTVPAK